MAATLASGRPVQRAGVNVESVRFHQRRGLLAEPARPLGGFRRDDDDDARRIRFIGQSQTLGFTLDEVAELLAPSDGRFCSEAEAPGAGKLAVVRERIAQRRWIERLLAGLVAQCQCNTVAVRCPLIEGMRDLSPRRPRVGPASAPTAPDPARRGRQASARDTDRPPGRAPRAPTPTRLRSINAMGRPNGASWGRNPGPSSRSASSRICSRIPLRWTRARFFAALGMTKGGGRCIRPTAAFAS